MPNNLRTHAALMLLLTLAVLVITAVTSSAQKTNRLEIEHWRDVLRNVERELKQDYYDPTFRELRELIARSEQAHRQEQDHQDQ